MTSENFYQRQTGTRRRRNRAVIIDSAKQPVRPAIAPDTKPSELARKSLKMFGIIVLSMMALLFVSVKLLEHLWSRRDRQLAWQSAETGTNSSPPAVLSPSTPVPERPALPVMPVDAAAMPSGAAVPESQVTSTVVRSESATGAEKFFRWGKMLEQAGEMEGALFLYEQAITDDPANPEALAQAGRLYIRLARYDAAVPLLQRAHALAPVHADTMNDLGVALTFHGAAAEAVAVYDRLLASHPDYQPALFNQGYALVQLREWTRARAQLETYLANQSSNAMALGVLAMVEVAETNTTRALELLDQAIEISPGWGTPYLDAAVICAAGGDASRAVSYLERALGATDPAEVYRHYAGPVFNDIRNSPAGAALEKKIAARAREVLAGTASPD